MKHQFTTFFLSLKKTNFKSILRFQPKLFNWKNLHLFLTNNWLMRPLPAKISFNFCICQFSISFINFLEDILYASLFWMSRFTITNYMSNLLKQFPVTLSVHIHNSVSTWMNHFKTLWTEGVVRFRLGIVNNKIEFKFNIYEVSIILISR